MTRRIAVPVLLVVACVAIVLAVVVGYVRRAAVDSDQFANRAAVVLRDDDVRSLIAERVTDQLVLKEQADLIAARPLIESVVSSVVGGRAFTGAFRSAVRDVHSGVFDRDEDTVILTVGDIGTIVAAGLEVVQPSLARRVRTTNRVELVRRRVGTVGAEAARVADTIKVLAWLFLIVAIAAAAGAIALSRDRRHTVVRLGVGTAIGGVVLLLALGIGRSLLVQHLDSPDARDAAGAVWDAFLGDLGTAAWILAGAGAVVAAAAASLIRPVELDEPLRRAGRWVTTQPTRPAGRVVRGVVLVAVGLLLLLDRDLVLQLLFTAAGVYLIYAGISAVLWVVYQPQAARREQAAVAGVGRTLVVAAIAVVLIVAAVGIFVGSGGTSTAAPASGTCEGSEQLCDRPLDEVALPATHNSMSVPLPGWFSSEQDAPIASQLQDGIRGLLIDTHYADRLPDGKLRTYVGDPAELRRQASADGVSPEAIDAALRIRERIGFSGEGTRGIYLCHSFCELGGTTLDSVLGDLHDFLVANPDAVVVVINQDYITPEDFVAAVEKAGLGDLVYRGPTARGKWPTLRRMIDTNQRVVFLAENHAGAAPWYHLAYDTITEETPYAFSKPQQLTDPERLPASCRPNRGPEGAPMFLVNHWITTDPIPLPSNAAKVNAYRPLMRRLRVCRKMRHHLPNLVAVNFYRRGDLFRAVDTLNGIK
ncbi:MAG TPA: hypothetical protein VGF25_12170 [Thermoleophilaceae bacterium]